MTDSEDIKWKTERNYYCAPFIRQDESNQETNPKYWFFIETLVYDEEIFKNRLHINGIDPENVLNMNLDLYEEE